MPIVTVSDKGQVVIPAEIRRRLGIVLSVADQIVEFGVDIFDEIAPQEFEVDVAGPHDRGGILVVQKRKQQVLERGIFLPALVGIVERLVERLLEAA